MRCSSSNRTAPAGAAASTIREPVPAIAVPSRAAGSGRRCRRRPRLISIEHGELGEHRCADPRFSSHHFAHGSSVSGDRGAMPLFLSSSFDTKRRGVTSHAEIAGDRQAAALARPGWRSGALELGDPFRDRRRAVVSGMRQVNNFEMPLPKSRTAAAARRAVAGGKDP